MLWKGRKIPHHTVIERDIPREKQSILNKLFFHRILDGINIPVNSKEITGNNRTTLCETIMGYI